MPLTVSKHENVVIYLTKYMQWKYIWYISVLKTINIDEKIRCKQEKDS